MEEFSTITAKGQTTVPKSVRQTLGVGAGDRVAFRVANGVVTVHRVEEETTDPAIDSFLAFLARDLLERPDRITALTPDLAARITALTVDMTVDDLDAPIDGPVDL